MGAPIGNQYAVGNLIGSALSYDPSYAKTLLRIRVIFPFFNVPQLLIALDIDETTFLSWLDTYSEFASALSPSKEMIEEYNLKVQEEKNKRRRYREQRRERPEQRLLDSIRARMSAALKGRTDGKLFQRLGFTVEQLKDHLESLFTYGMSWNNYGKWHVDHIKPCSSFNLSIESEFDKCWSLSNLQPLWSSDNLKKGAKYAGP